MRWRPFRLTAEKTKKLNKKRKEKKNKTNKFNAAAFDCMQSLAYLIFFYLQKENNKHIDNKLDLVFTTEDKREDEEENIQFIHVLIEVYDKFVYK